VLTESDGSKYTGWFENGIMTGEGVYSWKNGNVYKG
jgi:hypothetical protein